VVVLPKQNGGLPSEVYLNPKNHPELETFLADGGKTLFFEFTLTKKDKLKFIFQWVRELYKQMRIPEPWIIRVYPDPQLPLGRMVFKLDGNLAKKDVGECRN
jgi:Zn-dependent protease with chaperone function